VSYRHLTTCERKKIAKLYRYQYSLRYIANALGRAASTISRELGRNSENGSYKSKVAKEKYAARRLNCRPKGKFVDKELTTYVREKLASTWSPEQIAGRLPLDYPLATNMRVSHSAIYRWLHRNLFFQAAALKIHLRRHGHKHGEKRGRFNGVRELKERSKLALRRKRLGDWEVDTIVSGVNRQACLLSVCDRRSRYCGLVLLKRRSASETMRGFQFLFGDGTLPLETITSDRGTEFACYKDVEEQWGIPFYFTRPHSPWQKPSVENLNGLVRQFFPKATNFQEVTQEHVKNVMDLINNRPRKSLNFKTPTEVLHLT